MHLFSSEPKNRPTVTELPEIIEEWSKRTGKSEEFLNEMYKLHLDYILYNMNHNEDALQINLPVIGRLSFNYFYGIALSSSYNKNAQICKRKLKLLKSFLWDKKFKKTVNYNIPHLRRFISKYNDKVFNFFNNFYKYLIIIEDENNKRVNKEI